MSSRGPVSLTRGPLPASVYWRRRAAVLGVVLLLVIGISRMFGSGEGDHEPSARTASAPTTSRAPVVPEGVGAVAGTTPSPTAPVTPPGPSPIAPSPTAPMVPVTTLPAQPTALPTPTGRCSDDDVNVSATIGKAEATRPVWIALSIKTNVQTACLWQLNHRAVQVQVTSGSDRIWSTLDCTKAVPSRLLTLRRDTPVKVGIKWSSARSDDSCSNHTRWALPGYYHAQVAALGGEPTDLQFRLTKPAPAPPKPKVTTSPTSTASGAPSSTPATPSTGKGSAAGKGKKNPTKKGPRSEPTGEPVHPD